MKRVLKPFISRLTSELREIDLWVNTPSNKTSIPWTPGSQIYLSSKNKTSIQWTPGSQIYRSNRKIIFSKKQFLKMIKKHKLCIIYS